MSALTRFDRRELRVRATGRFRIDTIFSRSGKESAKHTDSSGAGTKEFLMIHRRNIAVAYVLAIPIFLGALFVELGALYKLNAAEGDAVKAMSASRGFDDLLAELREAEKAAQGYVASGSDDYRLAYGNAAGRVNGALDRLEEQTRDDPKVQSPEAQANLRKLRGATAERLGALERAMSTRSTRPTERANASEEIRESDAEAAMGKIVAELRGDEQSRAEEEQANAARSAESANTLVKYAGVLTIWMIGVAALLLFHDDRASFRGRIEQRLHSDILESLPLGVCLASESGVILYANPAAESSFGYRPGELVARNVESLHESSERGSDSRIAEILEQMFGHEIWSGELSLRTREGETVRADSWISSIRVGGKDCRLLVHRAAGSGSTPEHSHAAAGVFRSAREAVRGTASLPGALAPDGPEPTRPPDSEPIGARGRSK
jgi:PAS domain S-box-containing protein